MLKTIIGAFILGVVLALTPTHSQAKSNGKDRSLLDFFAEYGDVDIVILNGKDEAIARLKTFGCLSDDDPGMPAGADCHSSQAIDLIQIKAGTYKVRITARTRTKYSLTIEPHSSDGSVQEKLHFKGELTKGQTEFKRFRYSPKPHSKPILIR